MFAPALSNSNLWILAVGLVLVVLNTISSSRVAPHIAGLFARAGRPSPAQRRAA
jgi:hypothetical protein